MHIYTTYVYVGSGELKESYFVALLVYSTRRFVLSFAKCYFVLVCFGPLSITITALGEEEERANLNPFRTFVRLRLFGFVCFLFFGVWEGLRLVIVALYGLLSYRFCD